MPEVNVTGCLGVTPCPVGDEPQRVGGRIRLGLLCLLVCLVAPVRASPLAVCVSDVAFPPFTFPDREGEGQRLVRLASERQGWQVEFISRPWRRCLAGVEQGAFSAVVGAAATAQYRSFMAFPQYAGQPDAQRAGRTSRPVWPLTQRRTRDRMRCPRPSEAGCCSG